MIPIGEVIKAAGIPALKIEQDYFAVRALSNSGMKDLAVSPMRYWWLHVRPDREPVEPTREMRLGSALHCAVLEPTEFEKRYTCELDASALEGALVTADDIRTWIKSAGHSPKGTRKADLINQACAIDANVVILDVEVLRYELAHAGKEFLKLEDWTNVTGMAAALLDEPKLQVILKDGQAEVPLFATDPETGVPLKAKLDWLAPNLILDVKTFSQKRGRSIEKSVTDAIWYEDYSRQMYFYSRMRGWPSDWNGDCVLAFVESDAPHEVRLRRLRAKTAGQPNLYWQRSVLEVRRLIRLYADCVQEFGERPWRRPSEIDPLCDEELPGLAFS